MPLYQDRFEPFAQPGQLVAVLRGDDKFPKHFYRVARVHTLPTLLFTITANAVALRVEELELHAGWMAQYRYQVTVAAARVVVRQPPATLGYRTRDDQFFVNENTEDDWGGNALNTTGRHLTEFYVFENERVAFDEIAGTAATNTRFSGFKFQVQPVPSDAVPSWPFRTIKGDVVMLDPLNVEPSLVHRLENFAGIVAIEQR